MSSWIIIAWIKDIIKYISSRIVLIYDPSVVKLDCVAV